MKDNKSIVIYFSRADENYMTDGIRNIDKGNTEIIAEMIQQITGADLFKIEPITSYPYNYKECCFYAQEEINNNTRPDLKSYLDNIDQYDWNTSMVESTSLCIDDTTRKIKLEWKNSNAFHNS